MTAATLPQPGTPATYRIALVCLGNICRSPMAHVVLASRIEDAGLADRVHLESFGTGDWHVGRPMDRRAAATLTAEGYDATRHRARTFGVRDADAFDLHFHVEGFWTAVFGAIVISIASMIAAAILPDPK